MSSQIESIDATAACSPPTHRPNGEAARPEGAVFPRLAHLRGDKQLDATAEYTLLLETDDEAQPGHWRFKVRAPDGKGQFEAADVEPDARGERLSLLTTVRALEALEGPSRVRLVGASRYVRQGITYGLPEWRENGWRWECFGQMVPVRDRDLWQRLDRALQFHQVDCRVRRRDTPHPTPSVLCVHASCRSPRHALHRRLSRAWGRMRRWLKTSRDALRRWPRPGNDRRGRKLAGSVG